MLHSELLGPATLHAPFGVVETWGEVLGNLTVHRLLICHWRQLLANADEAGRLFGGQFEGGHDRLGDL